MELIELNFLGQTEMLDNFTREGLSGIVLNGEQRKKLSAFLKM